MTATGRENTADVVTQAEYTKKLERLLDDAKNRFQQMELDQMKKGEVEARAQLAHAQKEVRQKREAFEKELKRVRNSSRDAWEKLQEGADSAWDDLQAAVEAARAEFAGEVVEEEEEETAGAGAS